MEGKLFKMVEGYTLSLTGSIDDLYGISGKQLAEDHQLHKLSLKNCEAISNGYDLVELFDEVDESIDYQEFDFSSFKLGFKKALEIFGDKKFSEEDMLKAIAFGWDYEGRPKEEMLEIYNINLEYNNSYFEDTKKYIQSLQQTEWDVIIEMEAYHDGDFINDGKTHIIEAKLRPRLDSGGCLILKRK